MSTNVVAQNNITLDECLDILFEQSAEYKMLQLQYRKDEVNHELSEAFKYFNIDLELGMPFHLYQGVQEVFNSNLEQYTLILNNTNDFAPTASLLSNYNLPTGGTLNAGLRTYYRAYNSDYSNDRESFKYSFFAVFSQPLFRANIYRINSETEKNNFKKMKLRFFENKNKLVWDAIDKFYNTLLKQKQIGLDKHKINKEQKELEEQKLKLKLGKTSEVEFISKELAVKTSELNFAKTEEELNKIMNDFLLFLGMSIDTPIVLEELVEFVPFNIPLDDALDLAIENNQDYQRMMLNLNIGKLDYEVKSSTRIETNFNASTLFSNQMFYRPVHEKASIYDYNVGFTVSVPLADGGKRNADEELSKIRLKEIKINMVEKEKTLKLVVSQYYSLLEFYKKQNLLLKEKIKISKDSYEIYEKEYNLGRLTFFELQEYENEIYRVEKEIIEASINYNKSILQLKIILGMEIF